MKAEIGSKSQSRFAVLAFICLTAAFFSGCGPASVKSTADSGKMWVADGMIAISRAVPAPQSLAPETLLGFLPGSVPMLASPAEHVGTWISIDRAAKSVALMDGNSVLNNFSAEGIDRINPGTYHLAHKQRSPLWYAPDSYFTARDLAVPAPGDRTRFRRGALGDFVVFLDKNTPLHCGPVWSTDIGGARMDENDLSRLYYRVDVGSVVEVK